MSTVQSSQFTVFIKRKYSQEYCLSNKLAGCTSLNYLIAAMAVNDLIDRAVLLFNNNALGGGGGGGVIV